MKKQIFKVTIAGQVISMYRRRNGIDKLAFDSIMNEHKANRHSPGKVLIARLKRITNCTNEDWLLSFLKAKAVADFGDWPGNLQEVIWTTLSRAHHM